MFLRSIKSKLKKYQLTCLLLAGILHFTTEKIIAEQYMTPDQAKTILWKEMAMKKVPITLTKDEAKAIKKSSRARVRNKKLNAWKTSNGGWFILDKVIGKHENIDIAVSIGPEGSIQGIEILQYRETYGHEIRNPKWLAQFFGRKKTEKILKLGKQIKNISGATLSSRHITDGINRWLATWDIVLQYR